MPFYVKALGDQIFSGDVRHETIIGNVIIIQVIFDIQFFFGV